MGAIFAKYDIFGAFLVTIELAVLSAIGALLIGTVVAILRMSPVPVLQLVGTSYVNLVRNTPDRVDGVEHSRGQLHPRAELVRQRQDQCLHLGGDRAQRLSRRVRL